MHFADYGALLALILLPLGGGDISYKHLLGIFPDLRHWPLSEGNMHISMELAA